MKKHILKIGLFVAVALVAGYNVYSSQQSDEMSDMALANVEALANGEGGIDRPDCVGAEDLCSEIVIYPDGWGEDILFDNKKREGWI